MKDLHSPRRLLAGACWVGAVHAAPLATVDGYGSYVSVEPYAPDIVRVRIATDSGESEKPTGYGMIASADVAGRSHKADGSGDQPDIDAPSSAILFFRELAADDKVEMARQFVQMQGAADKAIELPAVEYCDWIVRAERTLKDLDEAAEATGRPKPPLLLTMQMLFAWISNVGKLQQAL